jgi:nucleotide-binding universal stress UspA family protein
MFRTVLVPLGRSENTELILRYAARIANAHGARVILLHVLGPSPLLPGPEGLPVPLTREAQDELRNEGVRFLGTVHERLREMGIDAGLFLARGPIGDSIAETARAVGADVVIMASRHRPWFSRILRESATKAIYDRLEGGCLLIVRADNIPC